jgi:putative ABC transport system permease protein
MSFVSRVVNAFRGGRVDRELAEELRFHYEARVEDLVRGGMSLREAEREARQRLGNSLAFREQGRDVRLAPWLETLWRDARFGVRMLAKDRTVTAAAAVSLALAIGACTAAFALIDAAILRPLPVREPEQLVHVRYSIGNPNPAISFSYPMLERLRAVQDGRVELFAVSPQFLRSSSGVQFGAGEAEKAHLQFVTGNFFTVLGLRPAVGRLLGPQDDLRPGAHPVAVISYRYWQRRFGGNPAALGTRFQSGDKQFQIVGVADRAFTGIEPGVGTDIWVPVMMGQAASIEDWGWNWLRILGRLRPGVTPEQARGPLQAAFTNARREWAPRIFGPNDAPGVAERYIGASLLVTSAAGGPSTLRQQFERPLWILAAVAGLVLLIACSNLANLFTARATAREREMALRASIGAGRGRLMQQVVVEGAMLAAAACALGLVCGAAMAQGIVAMLGPAREPVYLDVHIGWRMAAFAVAAGAAATLLFALVPALRASSANPNEALKAGGGKHSGRRAVLRPMLAAQIALSFAVLFVGGLFLLSFQKLAHLDLGFEPQGVMLVTVATSDSRIQDGHLRMLEVLDRVREVPGVKAAGISQYALFSGTGWSDVVRIPGKPPNAVDVTVVPTSPGWFEAMGIRRLAGRDLTRRDVETGSGVVLVNEAFARQFFPGEDPVGKRFFRPESRRANRDYADVDRGGYPQDIVGLVRDAHYTSVREPAPPTYYIPLVQVWTAPLAVRTAGDPQAVIAGVREAVRRYGRQLRTTEVQLEATLVNDDLIRERLLAVLSGFFALAAVVLAGVGLYGVLSYAVVRRTREIGIRVALGARRAAVVRLVVAEVGLVTAVGLAAGLAGGKLLAGAVGKLLFEVKATDAASIGLPLGLLLAGAAVAAVRPALRAARVDPGVALREE